MGVTLHPQPQQWVLGCRLPPSGLQPLLGSVSHLQVSILPLSSQQKGLESPLLVMRFLVTSRTDPTELTYTKKVNLLGGSGLFAGILAAIQRGLRSGPETQMPCGWPWEALSFSLFPRS